MTDNNKHVGVIGLGIMGHAYANLLINGGWHVVGFDIDKSAIKKFSELGGQPVNSPAEVINSCDIVLIALPSESAFESALGGSQGIISVANSDNIICELSTLSLGTKEKARKQLEHQGATLLDCPVSGTGAQAAVGDLVIYASGDKSSVDKALPVLDAIGRQTRFVGEFGKGTKLKLVANLLVTIHNLAAAEALLLAERSGLDLQLTFDAISAGAGTSRMFDVRGPMMVADTYEPATMKQDIFKKDIELILEQTRQTNTPAPLFLASLPVYLSALAQGRGKQDTASVFATLRKFADNITATKSK